MSGDVLRCVAGGIEQGIITSDFELSEIATRIRDAVDGLERIASMTDIECDFDGFEAREIAIGALRING